MAEQKSAAERVQTETELDRTNGITNLLSMQQMLAAVREVRGNSHSYRDHRQQTGDMT